MICHPAFSKGDLMKTVRARFPGVFAALCLFVFAGGGGARAGFDALTPLAPTSGWLVGQAAVSGAPQDLAGIPLPCIALNQFENGFTLRLSGGGGRLAAMAVDFRQSAFTRGARHPVRVSVDDSYARDFTATAFDAATLVLDLGKESALYDALRSGSTLILGFGGSVAAFDIRGLPDGLARLESCHRPQQGAREAAIPPQPEPRTQPPLQNAAPQDKGSGRHQAQPIDETAPLKIDAALDLAARTLAAPPPSAPAGSKAPDAKPNVWSAVEGEKFREILARWSREAGVGLVWNARQGDGTLDSAFRHEGPFEEAVTALLERSGKPLSGRVEPPALAPVPVAAREIAAPEHIAPQAGGNDDKETWVAAEGADLRDTLALWSRKKGVALVWQAPSSFAVPMDMSLESGYESAVEELLERTASGSGLLRPVGALNRDPGSGRSTLVIRAEGKS